MAKFYPNFNFFLSCIQTNFLDYCTFKIQSKYFKIHNMYSDCLRTMWRQSRQDIRYYEKHPKRKHDKNEEVTKTIHDFFVVMEDGKKWSFDAVSHAVNVFESAFMNWKIKILKCIKTSFIISWIFVYKKMFICNWQLQSLENVML